MRFHPGETAFRKHPEDFFDSPAHLSIPFCGWPAIDLFILVAPESPPSLLFKSLSYQKKREGKDKDFCLIMKNLRAQNQHSFTYDVVHFFGFR